MNLNPRLVGLMLLGLVVGLALSEGVARLIDPRWRIPYPPQCYAPGLYEQFDPHGLTLPGRWRPVRTGQVFSSVMNVRHRRPVPNLHAALQRCRTGMRHRHHCAGGAGDAAIHPPLPQARRQVPGGCAARQIVNIEHQGMTSAAIVRPSQRSRQTGVTARVTTADDHQAFSAPLHKNLPQARSTAHEIAHAQ